MWIKTCFPVSADLDLVQNILYWPKITLVKDACSIHEFSERSKNHLRQVFGDTFVLDRSHTCRSPSILIWINKLFIHYAHILLFLSSQSFNWSQLTHSILYFFCFFYFLLLFFHHEIKDVLFHWMTKGRKKTIPNFPGNWVIIHVMSTWKQTNIPKNCCIPDIIQSWVQNDLLIRTDVILLHGKFIKCKSDVGKNTEPCAMESKAVH